MGEDLKEYEGNKKRKFAFYRKIFKNLNLEGFFSKTIFFIENFS